MARSVCQGEAIAVGKNVAQCSLGVCLLRQATTCVCVVFCVCCVCVRVTGALNYRYSERVKASNTHRSFGVKSE